MKLYQIGYKTTDGNVFKNVVADSLKDATNFITLIYNAEILTCFFLKNVDVIAPSETRNVETISVNTTDFIYQENCREFQGKVQVWTQNDLVTNSYKPRNAFIYEIKFDLMTWSKGLRQGFSENTSSTKSVVASCEEEALAKLKTNLLSNNEIKGITIKVIGAVDLN